MTPPKKPAGTTYRFGKNAVLRVAPGMADGSKPLAASFKVLCLVKDVSIALTNGKISLENFCTGGNTIDIPDGTSMGEMTIGEANWTEADPALLLMEAAAQNTAGTETGNDVWFEVCPLGIGTTKPVYDVPAWVEKWELKMPDKGVITVNHTINVYGKPQPGVQA